MNNVRSKHELFEEIRREHEELRVLLGDVKRMLATRRETAAGVVDMITSLAKHVETHFAEEEVAGLFDNVVERAPHLADRVDCLRTQHQQLLAAVRQLNQDASASDSSSESWQRLDTAFHEFSTELMHHESAENDVLLEAYNDDIGVGD